MAEQETKTQTVVVQPEAKEGSSKKIIARKPNRAMGNKDKKQQNRNKKRNDDLEKRIVSIRRVARTYKGGKRMRLSVVIVVGDRKGKVGVGIGKGLDVKSAEEKAYNRAKKSMKLVPLRGNTIPHQILLKKKAARVFMKPAAPGTGVIAGGAMRAVLEVVGIKDVLTKVIGSSNSISTVYATIEALNSLISHKRREDVK